MDRNVYASTGGRGVAVAAGPKQPKAAEKLLKYFPAEALAMYTALDPAIRTVFPIAEDGASPGGLVWGLWGALVVSVVFCFLFLQRFWNVERLTQLAISCGALILYVFSLGGPFAELSWYAPGWGIIASVIATGFMIFVKAPTAPEG